MNIIITNSSGLPIFEQIENAIKEAIFSNELKEGEMLPSVRSLANELKISFLTVNNVIIDRGNYEKNNIDYFTLWMLGIFNWM